MAHPIPIDGLEIVGYADSLTRAMVPSVVPPIFRSKAEPDRVYLPPYHINAGFLYNAAEVSTAELRDLAHGCEVTLFEGAAFEARRDCELWLDEKSCPQYQLQADASDNLSKIANTSIKAAEAALRAGNLEEAERLSGIAASADDRRIEPFAIQWTIDRANRSEAGQQLMAELSASMVGSDAFNWTCERYFRCIPKTVHSPLHRVALARAA